MDMPDELDLAALRAKGLQPGEEELPEEQAGSGDQPPGTKTSNWRPIILQLNRLVWVIDAFRNAVYAHVFISFHAAVNIDENIVAQLADMGFDINGCRKAVYNTQSAGIEPAMNWVMEHMGDPGG